MDFWGSLAEGSFTGLLKGAGSLFKDVRTAITGKEPMSEERQIEMLKQIDAATSRLDQIEAMGAKGQIDLNLIDGKSGSFFKGGWRPAIGWCCVAALTYSFLLRPLLPWTVEVIATFIVDPVVLADGKVVPGFVLPIMPALDMQEIMGLVFTLLGMGGFRMYEKIKGVASK